MHVGWDRTEEDEGLLDNVFREVEAELACLPEVYVRLWLNCGWQ